ncbi:hypothetical protein [Lacticaseibacillus daqingensis]|uniref:hypothetical protein n=1 Tax=Lacticaseibacillus daqingensis TaxID=2486014 RepID=UPI000F78A8D3|nr:hypothetical protein [Lacticaseibacillus daqingensis]
MKTKANNELLSLAADKLERRAKEFSKLGWEIIEDDDNWDPWMTDDDQIKLDDILADYRVLLGQVIKSNGELLAMIQTLEAKHD